MISESRKVVLDCPIEPLYEALALTMIRRAMQHPDAFESAHVLEMLVSELTSVVAVEQHWVVVFYRKHLLKEFVHC